MCGGGYVKYSAVKDGASLLISVDVRMVFELSSFQS